MRQRLPLVTALALSVPILACGSEDADKRYAGLGVREVRTSAGSYRLRYLHPPWTPREDDLLVTGARESVPVGGSLRDVVENSSSVLEIGSHNLEDPKYRLEASLIACDEDELASSEDCAPFLAATDHDGRGDTDEGSFFGPGEREAQNDFGQTYFEFMTRALDTFRYRRIVYFQAEERLVALRLFIEADPGLGDDEMNNMVRAVELFAADSDAGTTP